MKKAMILLGTALFLAACDFVPVTNRSDLQQKCLTVESGDIYWHTDNVGIDWCFVPLESYPTVGPENLYPQVDPR